MANIPTMKEELERKVLEQLEALLFKLDKGMISEAQLKAALDSIYDCVSGLIDWEICEAISTTIKREINDLDHSFCDSRTFLKEGKAVIISRYLGDNQVRVKSSTPSGMDRSYTFSDETHPSYSAMLKQEEICGLLKKNGWGQVEP